MTEFPVRYFWKKQGLIWFYLIFGLLSLSIFFTAILESAGYVSLTGGRQSGLVTVFFVWPGAVVFTIMVVWALNDLINPHPLLILTADGLVLFNLYRGGFAAWRDVKAVTVKRISTGRGSVRVLSIRARSFGNGKERELRIGNAFRGVDIGEVARIVREYRRAATGDKDQP